jgi:hypothetical protein
MTAEPTYRGRSEMNANGDVTRLYWMEVWWRKL